MDLLAPSWPGLNIEGMASGQQQNLHADAPQRIFPAVAWVRLAIILVARRHAPPAQSLMGDWDAGSCGQTGLHIRVR